MQYYILCLSFVKMIIQRRFCRPSSGTNMMQLSLIYMAHQSHVPGLPFFHRYQLIVVCPSFAGLGHVDTEG